MPSAQFHSQKGSAAGGLEEVAVSISQGIKADSVAEKKAKVGKRRVRLEHPCDSEYYSDPAHLLLSLMTLAP